MTRKYVEVTQAQTSTAFIVHIHRHFFIVIPLAISLFFSTFVGSVHANNMGQDYEEYKEEETEPAQSNEDGGDWSDVQDSSSEIEKADPMIYNTKTAMVL